MCADWESALIFFVGTCGHCPVATSRRAVVLRRRRSDEPAAAGGDERVVDVDQQALTDTAQRRSAACEHMHLAPGPDSQDQPVELAGPDEQRSHATCGSGADHVVL